MYPALHRMETTLMSNFGRKAAIAAVAFATVGSTLFGGAALAGDKNHGKDVDVATGPATATATGGAATNNCLNILSGIGVGLAGQGTGTACAATGGDAAALANTGLFGG
jgi:hypothetical protein